MTNTKSSAQLPFGSVGFHITSALPLQTLRGIGMHHITSHDYHWDNRVRKTLMYYFSTRFQEKEVSRHQTIPILNRRVISSLFKYPETANTHYPTIRNTGMFFIWNFPPSVSLFSTTFIFPVDLSSTWKHPVLYLNR